MRLKWMFYLADLVKSKKKGACPFCGADAVHYAITILCEERGDGFGVTHAIGETLIR